MSQLPTTTSPLLPVYSREELRSREPAVQADRASFGQLAKDAANSEWSTSWFARWAVEQTMPVDRNFVLTAEFSKELSVGLDPSLWGEFARAESVAHAYYIRETMLDVQESRERLAAAGVTGAALTIGSAILDPGFLASAALVEIGTAGLGTGGVVAIGAAKASRIRSAARMGLLSVATDVPIQAFLSSQDPEQGANEVLFALAGGTILGGGLGAAFPRGLNERAVRQASRLKKDLEAAELAEELSGKGLTGRVGGKTVDIAGHEFTIGPPEGAVGAATAGDPNIVRPLDKLTDILSDKGEKYFTDQTDPARQRERVDNLIDTIFDPDFDDDLIQRMKAMEPNEALGLFDQMQRDNWERPSVKGQKDFPSGPLGKADDGTDLPSGVTTRDTEPGDLDTSWAGAGMDRMEGGVQSARLPTFTAILGRSKSPLMRIFGAASIHDDLPRRLGQALGDNAEDMTRRTRAGLRSVYERGTGKAFKNFAETKGVRATGKLRKEFNRMVSQAIREGGHANADVAEAADVVRGLQNQLRALMDRHGVEGFGEIVENPNYLMRVWNTAAIHAADQKYGKSVVNGLIRASIHAATPDIDEKLLDRIVKGFTDEIRTLDQVNNRAKSAMLDGENADALADMLRRMDGIEESDIEQLIYRVTNRGEDAGKINRAKHRLLMDETTQVEAPDGEIISLQQLLEDDVDSLFGAYLHESTAAAATADVYRTMGLAIDPDGGTVIRNWDQLEGILIKDLRDGGHTEAQITEIIKHAKMVDRHIRGMPMREHSKAATWGRRARTLGHIFYSGTFGMTQQIEWGTLVGEAGVLTTLQQMPELLRIAKRSARGQIQADYLDTVQSMTGLGADFINSRYLEHFDYKDAFDEALVPGSRIDRALQQGSRIANIASLMTPTMVIQKRWSISLATQKWLNFAQSGKVPSQKRLDVLGLTKQQGEAIANSVKKYATTSESAILPGRKVKELDIDRWLREDPVTANLYINSVDRWSTRVVQNGDIGGMMPWTTSTGGRIVTQFRTFVLEAWEKQFLHRVQMRDAEAFTGAAATFLASAMVYMGRTQLQSVGRDDRDEFLAKRMTPGEIARGASRYTGFSSFMPDVIDTILPNKYRLFNRASGLSTDIFDIGTAPVPSMAGNFAKGVGSLLTGALDGQLTQDEWKTVTKLAPYQNLVGIRNIIEGVGSRLPEDED